MNFVLLYVIHSSQTSHIFFLLGFKYYLNSMEYILISHFIINLRNFSSCDSISGDQTKTHAYEKSTPTQDRSHMSDVVFAAVSDITSIRIIGAPLHHDALEERYLTIVRTKRRWTRSQLQWMVKRQACRIGQARMAMTAKQWEVCLTHWELAPSLYRIPLTQFNEELLYVRSDLHHTVDIPGDISVSQNALQANSYGELERRVIRIITNVSTDSTGQSATFGGWVIISNTY